MSGERRERGTRDGWGASVAMVAVIVATLLVASALVLVVGVTNTDSKLPSPDVADAAVPRLERVLSYTPENIEEDLKVEQVYLTGDYREEYVALIKDTLGPQSRRKEVSAKATVTQTAVMDATAETMVVLMLVDLVTTRSGRKASTVDNRFKVALRFVDGQWLLAGLDVI